jgi:hypothetical protein
MYIHVGIRHCARICETKHMYTCDISYVTCCARCPCVFIFIYIYIYIFFSSFDQFQLSATVHIPRSMVGTLAQRTSELVFGCSRWMNPLYRSSRRFTTQTAFMNGLLVTRQVDVHKASIKLRNRGVMAHITAERNAMTEWVAGSDHGIPQHVPTLKFSRVIIEGQRGVVSFRAGPFSKGVLAQGLRLGP